MMQFALQYDGNISIATGSSRTAAKWKNKTLSWGTFLSQISETTRTRETLAEYKRMAKAKQDAIKDVGGFVGGWLKQGRRKADSLEHRSIITLDADFATADLLGAFALVYGNAAAVYSTHKHTPENPRLRLIVPLTRTVSGDEYQAASRKLAEALGIDLFDDTTYQPTRLMYWPSTSSDGDYVFDYCDGPFLDPDSLLALYPDWRDTSFWPENSRCAVVRKTTAERQGNPLEKPGVVGAFCRCYDIEDAISTFLDDKYTACDMAGRYTYTGGSTAAGLVVYDDGLFAYSNHATDPASGRLCNAFDLVRLHLYGAEDLDAADDTPVNRLPSYKAMQKFAENDPTVAALMNRERGERAIQDFSDAIPHEEELVLYVGSLEKKPFTTSMLEKLLPLLGIDVRYNEITHREVMTGGNEKLSTENSYNVLPVLLLDIFRPAGVKSASKAGIADSLDLILEGNRFNPVADYLQSIKWDGKDRAPELAQMLGLSPGSLPATLFYKGLWQAIAMAHNGQPHNLYGADGVPVLQDPQGIGKTTAIRAIIPKPLQHLFKDGVMADPRNKDTIIAATSIWVGELGELDGITKRDQQGLKAFITSAVDKYRVPYARKDVEVPRRTAFFGTVNPEGYLTDTTGNRRFWTIRVQNIELEQLLALTEEWKAQLWAQVYADYLASPQGFRLTKLEQAAVNLDNIAHERPLGYELEVLELLDFDLPREQWGVFTTSEVADRLSPFSSIPLNLLGKALTNIARKYEAQGVAAIPRNKSTVYALPMLKGVAEITVLPHSDSPTYPIGGKGGKYGAD